MRAVVWICSALLKQTAQTTLSALLWSASQSAQPAFLSDKTVFSPWNQTGAGVKQSPQKCTGWVSG